MKGPVDKLIGNHKIRRLVLFLERADGRNRQNPLDAQFFHGIDIGAEVQLRGQDAVPSPMPGKKRHLAPLQLSQYECL